MADIRFIIGAVLLVCGMVTILLSVWGANKFHFVMNRMHSAAIIDSMGLFLVVIGLAVLVWDMAFIPKLLLILVFQWISSPIASHMVGRLEVQTDDTLLEHMKAVNEEGGNRA